MICLFFVILQEGVLTGAFHLGVRVFQLRVHRAALDPALPDPSPLPDPPAASQVPLCCFAINISV